MTRRLFFIFLTISTLLSTIVYSNFTRDFTFNTVYQSANNINIESQKLNNFIVGIYSSIDISKNEFFSTCRTNIDFLSTDNDVYYYKINFLDTECEHANFYLKHKDEIIINTNFYTNISKKSVIFNILLDLETAKLSQLYEKLSKQLQQLPDIAIDYNNINTQKIRQQRNKLELEYITLSIKHILAQRELKYTIPVRGHKLPTRRDKLPNSPRPYRSNYTHGVHEGWDIDAPLGTEVMAIDDGIVLRVVRGFKFRDLQKITYGNNLTDIQKFENLDILRGNQVWLKTMKGDVLFYSHLKDVYDYIDEGDFIRRETPIGTIGITGVPDKNYTDYHLHFELRKNPYNKVGTNQLHDYMGWDWYFKDKDTQYVIENQYNIFNR